MRNLLSTFSINNNKEANDCISYINTLIEDTLHSEESELHQIEIVCELEKDEHGDLILLDDVTLDVIQMYEESPSDELFKHKRFFFKHKILVYLNDSIGMQDDKTYRILKYKEVA